jgi:hypothetical protein
MIMFLRVLAWAYIAFFLYWTFSGAFGNTLFYSTWLSVAMIFGLPVSFTYLLWARHK